MARRSARHFREALLLTTCLVAASSAVAQPVGGVVVGGQATISNPNATTTLVKQGTNRAALDWQKLDVPTGYSLVFEQPGASSIALNRVQGGAPSAINGNLTANGQVWFVNPAGVMFGKGARIDVGGLVASTAGIGVSDFMNGRSAFDQPGNPGAAIVNEGEIRAAQGGYAVLAGERVENRGLVEAQLGTVVLGGVKTFALDFHGDKLLRFEVTGAVEGVPDGALVTNAGTARADGGRVLLAASAARSVVDNVINTSGIVEARSVQRVNGEIVLLGEGGGVEVSGRLDASGRAAGETGGSIAVNGATVKLGSTAQLDASGDLGGGTILVGKRADGVLAKETTLAEGARVAADAVASGQGGHIELWSKERTTIAGRISARGGAAGGDGGFVETSSVGALSVRPSAEVSADAPKGSAGNWLLDPNSIVIASLATTLDVQVLGNAASKTITSDSQNIDSVVDVATIANALDNGTNVTVATAFCNCAPTEGNITLAAALTTHTGLGAATPTGSNVGNVTLTLSAAGDILIDAPITASQGKINLFLNSGVNDTNTGTVTVKNTISTGNGNVTATGKTFVQSGGVIATGTGNFTVNANSISLNSVSGTGTARLAARGFNSIGVGTGAGTLQLSQSTIDKLAGFNQLILGSTGNGPLTVGGPLSLATSTRFESGSFVRLDGSTVLAMADAGDKLSFGGGTASIGGTLLTRGGTVTFDSGVSLFADAVIDTTNGGGVPTGANVTFNQSINDSFRNLTVVAGSAGDIMFNNFVGSLNQLVTSSRDLTLGRFLTGVNKFTHTGTGTFRTLNPFTFASSGEIAVTSPIIAIDGIGQFFSKATFNAGTSFTMSGGQLSSNELSVTSPIINLAGNALVNGSSGSFSASTSFNMNGSAIINMSSVGIGAPMMTIADSALVNASTVSLIVDAGGKFQLKGAAALVSDNLTLLADQIELDIGTTIAGFSPASSKAFVRPTSPGASIGIGDAAETFQLSGSEIGAFQGFPLVTIGGSDVTKATIGGAIDLATNVTVQALAPGGQAILESNADIGFITNSFGNTFLFGIEGATVTQKANGKVALGTGTLLLGGDAIDLQGASGDLTGRYAILRGSTLDTSIGLESGGIGTLQLTQAGHIAKLQGFDAIAVGDPRFGSGNVTVGDGVTMTTVTTGGSISFGGGAGSASTTIRAGASVMYNGLRSLGTDYVALLAGPGGTVTVETGASVMTGAASIVAAAQNFAIDGDVKGSPGALAFITSGGLGKGSIGVGDATGFATDIGQTLIDDAGTDYAVLQIGDIPSLLAGLRPSGTSTGIVTIGNVNFPIDVVVASSGGDIRLLPGTTVSSNEKSIRFETHVTLAGGAGSTTIDTDLGTAGGNVTFVQGLDDPSFGSRSLAVAAGTGKIEFQSAVASSSFMDVLDLTARTVELDNGFRGNTLNIKARSSAAGSARLSGFINLGNLNIDADEAIFASGLGGNVSTLGVAADKFTSQAGSSLFVFGDATVTAGRADFDGTLSGNSKVTIATTGGLTQNAGFIGGFEVALSAGSMTLAGQVQADDGLTLSSTGALTLNPGSFVNASGGATITANSLVQTAGSTLQANGLAITTDAITLGGTVTGTGDLILAHSNPAASISIGTDGADTFDISAGTLGAISGFDRLFIGNSSTSSIRVGMATLPVSTFLQGGSLVIETNLSLGGGASFMRYDGNSFNLQGTLNGGFASVVISADAITATGAASGTGFITLFGKTFDTIDVGGSPSGSTLFIDQTTLTKFGGFGTVVIGDLFQTDTVNINTATTTGTHTAFGAKSAVTIADGASIGSPDKSLFFFTGPGGTVTFGNGTAVNPGADSLIFAADSIVFQGAFGTNHTGALVVAPGIGSSKAVSFGTNDPGTLIVEDVLAKFAAATSLTVGLQSDGPTGLPATQNVELGGSLPYTGPLTFAVDPITGAIRLVADTTISTFADVKFIGAVEGTTPGGQKLTVNADANEIFIGSAGNGVALGEMKLKAGDIVIADDSTIRTKGQAITFDGAVSLGSGGPISTIVIDTTGGGAAPAGATVSFLGTLDGREDLLLTTGAANTVFGGLVGNRSALQSLEGGNALFTTAVGKIYARDYVILGNVEGATDLSIVHDDGILDFVSLGSVGASSPLLALTIGAETIDLAGTKYMTTGKQDYQAEGGLVRFLSSSPIQLTADSAFFDGSVALSGDLTVNIIGANGGLDITEGLRGGSFTRGGLKVSALGSGVNQVNIGNDFINNPISFIDIEADIISIAGVNTIGSQTYRAGMETRLGGSFFAGGITSQGGAIDFFSPKVVLSDYAVIDSNGGNINFHGAPIEGPFGLSLVSDSGFTTVGDVGQLTPLEYFEVYGRGAIGRVRTTDFQEYGGAFTFSGELRSTGTFSFIGFESHIGPGSGTFTGTAGKVIVDPTSEIYVAGPYTMTAAPGQVIEFFADTDISSFSSGNTTINGPLVVHGDMEVRGNGATVFSSGVQIDSALFVNNFAGTATFAGGVGADSLSTSGGGVKVFKSTVAIANSVFLGNSGGSVRFEGALNSNGLTASGSNFTVALLGGGTFGGDVDFFTTKGTFLSGTFSLGENDLFFSCLPVIDGLIATNGGLVDFGDVLGLSGNATINAGPAGTVRFKPGALNLGPNTLTVIDASGTRVFGAPVTTPPPIVAPPIAPVPLDSQALIDQLPLPVQAPIAGLPNADFSLASLDLGSTEIVDTTSSESSGFAAALAGQFGDEGAPAEGGGSQQGGSQQQSGAQRQGGQGTPGGQQQTSRPKQDVAPPVSSVTQVFGDKLGIFRNTSNRPSAGAPGLGGGDFTSSGNAMP